MFKALFKALQAKGFDFDKTFMSLTQEEMALLCASVQEAMPQYSLPYLKYMPDGTQVLCIPANAPPDAQWWNGSSEGRQVLRDVLTKLGATPQTMAAYGCASQDDIPF